ncbi:MAG: transposase [Thermoplasmatales archaeon]|nr:transposase [Thermoplasmatales archaeon]MCW6170188.1 transposase [Thermoplasmatales archaeon]
MLKEETTRIVTESLLNSEFISEICEKYNLTSSAFYKWRDEFISVGATVMEQGKSGSE